MNNNSDPKLRIHPLAGAEDKFAASERSRGQVLVEAIVAITLITVGLLGIYAFITHSFGLNRVVADKYIGTYLAAEGIEIAKNLLDAGVVVPVSDDYELDYTSTNFGSAADGEFSPLYFDNGYYSYDSGSGSVESKFTRKISIELIGDDETKVVSRVEWVTRGGGESNTELEAHFYNWKPE